jgi:hypothetical protein
MLVTWRPCAHICGADPGRWAAPHHVYCLTGVELTIGEVENIKAAAFARAKEIGNGGATAYMVSRGKTEILEHGCKS